MHTHRHICGHVYNQCCMIILLFSDGFKMLTHSDNLHLPIGSQQLGWHLVMLLSVIYLNDQRGHAMH